MKKLSLRWFLVSTPLLLSACAPISFVMHPPAPPPPEPRITQPMLPSANYAQFVMPELNIGGVEKALDKESNEIKSLLDAENFKAIEEKAEAYAKSKERLPGGLWKIRLLNRVLTQPTGRGTDLSIEAHIGLLQKWKSLMPESILARSSLVDAMIGHAWEARGTAWAKDVADDQMSIYSDRMKIAAAELKDASQLSARCHLYYLDLLTMAMEAGWDRDSYEKVFGEAVAFEPEYESYYINKASYLLPRWNGKPGELGAFLKETRDSIGGDRGLEMYYSIAEDLDSYRTDQDFFYEMQISWADAKEGFRLRTKEYGASKNTMNVFGQLARRAGDAVMICSIFRRLPGDDSYAPGVWKDLADFQNAQKRADTTCDMLSKTTAKIP